jgi:HAD superfamily hydrolase (TIGR01509 family)
MNSKTRSCLPSALIFDMDGVIVDNSKYHNLSWIEFCRRHGRQISADEIENRFGNTNVEYIRHIFGNDFSEEDIVRYGEEKERIYREMYAEELRPAKGLIPLLEQAALTEIPCAVATAAPDSNVDFVIDGTGIRKYFRFITSAGMVAKGKPDPEIYLKTAAMLQVSPGECVVFEDSFFGIRAGKAAGMKVVALTSSYPADKIKAGTNPDMIVESFEELDISLLEKLFC